MLCYVYGVHVYQMIFDEAFVYELLIVDIQRNELIVIYMYKLYSITGIMCITDYTVIIISSFHPLHEPVQFCYSFSSAPDYNKNRIKRCLFFSLFCSSLLLPACSLLKKKNNNKLRKRTNKQTNVPKTHTQK